MRCVSFTLLTLAIFAVNCEINTTPVFAQANLDRLERALAEPVPPRQDRRPTGVTDRSTPGYLGFNADSIPAAGGGVILSEIHPGSPAEKAGFKAGDVIKGVNGTSIKTLEDLKAVASLPPGSVVAMEIEREGKRLKITATVGIRAPAGATVAKPAFEPPKLGVTIVPITATHRRTYRLSAGEGVFVKSVRRNSAADKAGIPLHSVIVAVDGIGVRSPDDLIALVQGTRPGNPIVVAYVVGRRLYRKTVNVFPDPATAPPVAAPPEPIQ